MDEKSKRLAFAIVEYLESVGESNLVTSDEKESLEVATQCIQDVFKIDVQESDQQDLFSMKPVSLTQVFDVYLQTKNAAAKKSKKASAKPAVEKKRKIPEADVAAAEDLKAQGNRLVAEKKFIEAIDKYTEAITLNPYNPIYFSNRAAAYSGDKQHLKAIQDALDAIKLDPDFSKGYSRLGHAYYATSQFEKAHDAYARCIELDPNNATTKQALAQTKAKLPANYKRQEESDAGSDEDGNEVAPRAAPNSAADGGMAGLLGNPDLMSAASQMLASNPQLAAMAQQFMGGGGGTPDLASMLNNPALMNMAQQAMQNPDLMGMLGGAGRGQPSPRGGAGRGLRGGKQK